MVSKGQVFEKFCGKTVFSRSSRTIPPTRELEAVGSYWHYQQAEE